MGLRVGKSEASAVWECRCHSGDSPVWLPDASTLLFCNSEEGEILSFDPQSGKGTVIAVGGRPSFVFPTHDGRLIYGSERELRLIGHDGTTAVEEFVDTPPCNRTSSGTVDGRGRLWFGVSNRYGEQPSGNLYRYHDERVVPMLFDMVIGTGPALSEDSRTLFNLDSRRGTIHRYRVSSAGSLSDEQSLLQLDEGEGTACGIALDAEDCLWLALSDPGCVRRYSPAGELMQQVELPCSRVTSLAFGGDDMHTLYITSAREGLGEEQLAAEPLAGALFALDSGVSGRRIPPFRLARGSDLGLVDDDEH